MKIKLTDLDPRWGAYSSNEKRDEQIINGLTFLCPHCGKETGQRLGILFHPPIDEGGWIAKGVTIFHSATEWTRTGDTFETITLSPSINTIQNRMGFVDHWHGFITDGIVT
jgi:hypothetical protein